MSQDKITRESLATQLSDLVLLYHCLPKNYLILNLWASSLISSDIN